MFGMAPHAVLEKPQFMASLKLAPLLLLKNRKTFSKVLVQKFVSCTTLSMALRGCVEARVLDLRASTHELNLVI